MSKLRRGFLDTKRLLAISLNYNTREGWFVDYVKAIGKGLQDLNNQEVAFENEVKDYVLYNGQTESLENYVDDQVDIALRRTIIQTNTFETINMYGYYDQEGNWQLEYDPRPTTLYGYTTGAGENYGWEREEDPSDTNPPVYGYIMYSNQLPLLNVTLDPILNSYEEFIYTIENALNESDYVWIRESQAGDRVTILIHDDKFNELTQDEIEELKGKIKRYIIAPYDNNFGIEGYS
jgi:hypothetical protein